MSILTLQENVAVSVAITQRRNRMLELAKVLRHVDRSAARSCIAEARILATAAEKIDRLWP